MQQPSQPGTPLVKIFCFGSSTLNTKLHVCYSLNSLRGDYIGDYIGDYYRVKEDTRSLDNGSCGVSVEAGIFVEHMHLQRLYNDRMR